MKRSKLFMLVGALLVGAMLLAACPRLLRPPQNRRQSPRPQRRPRLKRSSRSSTGNIISLPELTQWTN